MTLPRLPDEEGLIPAHAGKTARPRESRQRRRAHPRSRGENPTTGPLAARGSGSSPLTRGKPQHVPGDRLRDGLIPAHAGKTARRADTWEGSRAHPRSRGENWESEFFRYSREGSSPLTRGKRCLTPSPTTLTRLIPAHAGKTSWGRVRPDPRRAHPRSRGENRLAVVGASIGMGSSPLTRGKPGGPLGGAGGRRLIPAHAGKTPRNPASRSPKSAHPRSRGENAYS